MGKTTRDEGNLFPERQNGVRVVLTGQVGMDKKPFVEDFAEIARRRGKEVALAHVGDMMYAEAPDVVPGRILDLPKSRLDQLRRSIFKDILNLAEREMSASGFIGLSPRTVGRGPCPWTGQGRRAGAFV